jgi:hypothetical protein
MKNAIKSIQPTRLTQYDDNSSHSITTGTRGVLNRKNIDVSNNNQNTFTLNFRREYQTIE